MYHTQEKRGLQLTNPIICSRNNAWLGVAYYFWDDKIDAIQWGHKSKRGTGFFEIYKAEIECEKILDTVFNEEHYRFWVNQIEKAAKHISSKTGLKPSLKEVNQYFSEIAKWSQITDGIMFQDLPINDELLVKDLFYRKRIQLAAYNLEIISNFAFDIDMKCN